MPRLAFDPGIPIAAVLVACATVGYAASLTQQEWLVALTPPAFRGQVLGAESSLRMTFQGVCAVLAGGLADVVPTGTAMCILAAGSLLVSLALTPALRPCSRRRDAVRSGGGRHVT